MKIKYFEDTDTMLIEFSDRDIVETIEVSENLYAEVDKEGKIITLTLEHASEYTDFSEISFSPGIFVRGKEILKRVWENGSRRNRKG